jgi:ketosteroid isomerase-like protein
MTTISRQSFGARMFAVADTLDVDSFVNYLAPDVHFRFGNAEPITGLEAVREAVGRFFTTIKGLQHTIVQEWHDHDTIIQQLDVTYTRLDDKQVTLPAINLLRMHDDTVADYRIYVDLAPVYA